MDMISYVIPIIKDNVLLGVAGVDINFEQFKKKVNDIKVYNTGYASLVNEKYDYLVHKTFKNTDNVKTVENGAFKSIEESMRTKKAGINTSFYNGRKNFLAFSHLKNGWVITVTASEKEVLTDIYKLLFVIGGIVILGIIAAIFVALYIGNKIAKPIVFATEMIHDTASLDLIYNMDEKAKDIISNKDETGIMGNALLNLRKELREIIQQLKVNSSEVLAFSQELHKSTEETTYSINGVSKTIDELAAGVQEQATDAQSGTEKLLELANEINAVNGNMDNGGQAMQQADQALGKVNEAFRTIEKSIEDTLEQVEILMGNVQRVDKDKDEVIESIQKISAISEEAAASSQEIAASMEEQTGSMENISEASEHLRGIAVKVEEIAGRFKI